MSEHEIDDIFKKSLKDQQHDFQSEDWAGARQMLGLDKKKRRVPIWWWYGSAAAVVFIVMITLKVSGVIFADDNIDQEILATASKENKVDQFILEDELEMKEDQSAESLGDDLEEEVAGSELNFTNNIVFKQGKVDQKASREVVNAKKRQRNQAWIDEASSQPQEVILTNIQSNVSSSNNRLSKSELMNSNELDQTDIRSERSKNGKLMATNEVEQSVGSSAVEVLKDQSVVNNTSLQLSDITSLQIFPFNIDDPIIEASPTVVKMVELESTIETTQFNLGAYGGVMVSSLSPAIGIYGELSKGGHLYANLGLGMNYRSSSSMNIAESFDVTNNRGTLDFSAEQIVKNKLYNLELPINIGYRNVKHHLFGGILLDYPIHSTSAVESELMLEMQDMAIDPANPGPTSLQPSSVVTLEQFTNAQDLQQINLQLRLGYGYAVSHKLRLELIAGYRVRSSQLERANSLFTNNSSGAPQIMVTPLDNNLSGGIQLRYQF